MELKEDMYVRYTRGMINDYVPPRIAKIVDCSDNDLVAISNSRVILKSDVIKVSDDLIDLIEVGDYVNGVEVIGKEFDNFNKEYLQCGVGDYVICTFEVKDIKTILTKEQFESQKYIVESE